MDLNLTLIRLYGCGVGLSSSYCRRRRTRETLETTGEIVDGALSGSFDRGPVFTFLPPCRWVYSPGESIFFPVSSVVGHVRQTLDGT